MFRTSILLYILVMAVPVFGQQAKNPPYQVPAPEGWGKETIELPPEFAPDMKWQGMEELRFAPNWRKAESETFFSYALLFWLRDSQKTDAKTMESELLAYYRGLAKAVSGDKKQDVDVESFTMTVKNPSAKPAKRASGEDVAALVGELKWIEPFTTGMAQTLHMEIQVWHSAKHTGRGVFICASPQPQTAEVWKSLREIREGCVLLTASSTGQGSEPSTMARTANDTAQIAEYVVEVLEDAKGNLWFGTGMKGVARFDGKTLTYLTEKDGLCGNTVVSIAEDKEGNLWFGTHTGVCKYDGKTFAKLSDIESRVHLDRQGNIWVSSNTGIVRYKDSTFVAFDLPIVRADISSYSITPGRAWLALEDSKGNLWFATDGYGAFKFDGKSFTHFTKKDGLCSNIVWSIMEDAKGSIWFTCIQSYQPEMTADGGVCRYDGKTFTKFPEVAGLSGNDIYTIYMERSGNIWIGATGLGAYRYNGETFTLFDQTDRPDLTKYFGVQSILEDRNGTLWFGFSGGLFRFDGTSFVNVTQGGPWTRLPITPSLDKVGRSE